MRVLVKTMIMIKMMILVILIILVILMILVETMIMMESKRGLRRMKMHLVAVTRSDEKERRMAMSSPQAAAQDQEGGPTKLLPLFNST